MKPVITAGLGVLLAIIGAMASAQSYPSRNIVLYSNGTGGVAESYFRVILDKVKENTGTIIILEGRRGAAGANAVLAIKRAAADGYSMGVTFSSAVTMNPLINPDLGIDTLKDFIPVTNLIGFAVVIAASSELPGKDIRDVIVNAKAKGTEIRVGTFGASNIAALLLIEERTGANFQSIPYKTSGDGAAAVMGNHIEAYFDSPIGVVSRAGKIKGLAYLGPTASPQLPGVPTTKELYGFDMLNWQGVLAPVGTPANAVNWVSQEMIRAVNDPKVKEKLGEGAYVVLGYTSAEFAATLKSELEANAALLRKYPQLK